MNKNKELGELNDDLMAAEEGLRQNIDKLTMKERELRDSEERFTRHIDNSPLGGNRIRCPVPDYLVVGGGMPDVRLDTGGSPGEGYR
jgi:hypothetical protein